MPVPFGRGVRCGIAMDGDTTAQAADHIRKRSRSLIGIFVVGNCSTSFGGNPPVGQFPVALRVRDFRLSSFTCRQSVICSVPDRIGFPRDRFGCQSMIIPPAGARIAKNTDSKRNRADGEDYC